MQTRDYIINLERSPLGVVMAAIAVGTGIAVALASSFMAGAALAVVVLVGLNVTATLTGLGPRAATAEYERLNWAIARRRLDLAKASRDRLASLRVPDQELKALLELAAVRGSAYLSACLAARSRDPRAEDALSDCVSLADIYLKELDGASTERRYGLDDADPFAAAKERTLAALRDRIAVVELAVRNLTGGLSPADAMEIKETL
ncbi:MAG: hypothetical protein CVV51_14165 [Spirochaetae bacterium HGW-Spirochaetae-7]|jgi:hypothetical protein|nr:MAG: hypothetical protein CVV51_14165 [Spirochaetae bacterium HGW-Spirochaetae-7]